MKLEHGTPMDIEGESMRIIREELEARARAKMEKGEFAYEVRAASNHLSQEQALDWLYQQMGLHSQYVFLHRHREENHGGD